MEFILVESYAAVAHHDRRDLAVLLLDFEYYQWMYGGTNAMVQSTGVEQCPKSSRLKKEDRKISQLENGGK